MHDINRIKDLQFRQKNLSSQYEELDVLLDDLKSLRKKQAFIPEDMASSITNMLTDVQSSQRSFLTDYNALDLGAAPSTITECKTELDDYETYILEKSTYVEVINFVLSLDSDNVAAKSALEQHKAFAVTYDCRSNSVDQCEKDLKKYFLLREAYRETDPTKRLSDIIELSPIIDFPLVVALNTNALFSADDQPAASPEKPDLISLQEEISETTPETMTVETREETVSTEPFSADPVFVEPVSKEPVSKEPVSKETVSTSAPMLDLFEIPNLSRVQEAMKIPDFMQTSEPVQMKTPEPMQFQEPVQMRTSEPAQMEIPEADPVMQLKKEFYVEQKPISGRPAPDETPVPHTGIENGLTAELNYVLSRETAAANLAASVDAPFSTFRASSYPTSPSQSYPEGWEKLGIRNPANVFYSVSDENMQIFRCSRPKKFSVSDFQKEMSLKSPNRFQKQWAIKDAYRYGATTPNMLAALIKEDPEPVEEACNTLVENGYLKAFELKGSSFCSFERLYVLTASGRKVFTNADTAAILNLAPSQKPATPPFASHANAVLNRLLFLNTKKLMEIYMPSREFNVGSFILETNSFINFFPTTNGTGTYAYVGVLGEDLKDYLIFKIELQEMLPTLTTINVVGMTKEHAKALTDWIYDSFSGQLAGKKLQLYAQETDTYYSYPQCVPFKVGY